jgi:hypothetical protein
VPIDAIAIGNRHHGLLHIRPAIFLATPALGLALGHHGVHGQHLHAVQRFDGSLDLRLGAILGDLKDDLVVFRHQGRLFGDHRLHDHVVMLDVDVSH